MKTSIHVFEGFCSNRKLINGLVAGEGYLLKGAFPFSCVFKDF